MSKNVKSQILSKVTDLLEKFADRLSRIGLQTGKNTAAIEALQDKQRVDVEALVHRDANTLDILDAVKKENDEREQRQILRDQNNTQSLVNLRDSAQKGFDKVRVDVTTLMQQIQRLNERVSAIAQETLGAAALPPGHVWVNKKLTGVYDSIDDAEKRIQKLEQRLKPLVMTYYGLEVRFLNNELYVGEEVFTFLEDIATVTTRSYGLLITLKNGDKYILCGGPASSTIYLIKKA